MTAAVIDVQVFRLSGTWHKPPQARPDDVVDVVTAGADGGAASTGHPGACGDVSVLSYRAADLPDSLGVTVGKGGRSAPAGTRDHGGGGGGWSGVMTADWADMRMGPGGTAGIGSGSGPAAPGGGGGGSVWPATGSAGATGGATALIGGGGGGAGAQVPLPGRDGMVIVITHLGDSHE